MKKKERLRIKNWTENSVEWLKASRSEKIAFTKYFITHSKENIKQKDKRYIIRSLVKSAGD